MAKLRKYLFDLDFGSPAGEPCHDAYGALGLTPRMPAPPEDMVVEAPPPPEEPPPPPMFSEEDLALVREQAYAAGHQAGAQDAQMQSQRIQADSLAAIAAHLANLAAVQQSDNAERLREAVHVAVAVVRKLHPELSRRFGSEEIAGVVQGCLAQLDRDSRVTIRIHPDLVEPIRDQAQQAAEATGFEGKLVFAADPHLAPGDCRVEWGGGGGERDQARIWAEIDAVLVRALGPAPLEPVAAAPGPESGEMIAEPA